MMIRKHRRLALCLSTLPLLAFLAFGTKARLIQQPTLSQQAYTILQQNCFGCHGAARTSELDLRTAEGVFTGGENGTLISGDTLAELARKHQVAQAVIARLRNFMDAEALRSVADGVALNLDTVGDAEVSAAALQARLPDAEVEAFRTAVLE